MLVSGLNRNGMVGKRFMIHNYNWFSGTLPEETHVYAGPASAGWAIDDTSGDTIDRSNLNFVGGTPVMFFGGDVQPIEAASVLMPPDVPMRGAAYKEWLRHGYRRLFGMYSQMASLPMETNYVDLDPKVKDPWGQPALRITHDWGDNDREAALWIRQIKHSIAREMGATKAWEAPLLPPTTSAHTKWAPTSWATIRTSQWSTATAARTRCRTFSSWAAGSSRRTMATTRRRPSRQ